MKRSWLIIHVMALLIFLSNTSSISVPIPSSYCDTPTKTAIASNKSKERILKQEELNRGYLTPIGTVRAEAETATTSILTRTRSLPLHTSWLSWGLVVCEEEHAANTLHPTAYQHYPFILQDVYLQHRCLRI